MDNYIEKIKGLAVEYTDWTKNIRRHLHQNPELSGEETATAEYITSILDEMEIPYVSGIAGNGICALIEGYNPEKKAIALRADMDALPLTESEENPIQSNTEGVMHACGHDMHMASMLGTARILKELSDEFEGTIKLIFQPSEESLPGGALPMIKEGILQNPSPEVLMSQHVSPEIPTGKIGVRSGFFMASTDEITLTVKGKGGHGAMPDLCIDPVSISAHIILALQQIVSRNANPSVPTVLTFGKVIANGRYNIIPNEVLIQGTLRTFNEEWREIAREKIIKIAQQTAQAMGGDCEVYIDKGYPALINNEEVNNRIKENASQYLGAENVVEIEARMTAEDFSYFANERPSCMYRIGTGGDGCNTSLHNPKFQINEDAIEGSIGLMAWLAVKELM